MVNPLPARITLFSALLVATLGCESPAPPHIIFITIDALRADHVSAYGYPRPTSPFLDELAARGVLFESAYATSSHTTPSHASMFLSQYPVQHGMLTNRHLAISGATSLPRRLEQLGYTTAGFPGARFLGSFSDWFSHFKTPVERVTPARTIVDDALSWLDRREEPGPVFIWLHFYDVHEWVRPDEIKVPEFYLGAMQAALPTREVVEYVQKEHGADPQVLAQTWQPHPIDRYDSRILAVDEQIRRLYEKVGNRLTDRDNVWIITSDHGEGLASHGWLSHGRYVYSEQIRIPLVMEAARWPKGHRVRENVSVVDFLPTILDLVGARAEEATGLAGRSLLPLLQPGGADWPHRFLYAERRPKDRGPERRSWVPGSVYTIFDHKEKYIVRTAAEDEYFDLIGDPLEQDNLAADGLPQAKDLRGEAQAFREALQADRSVEQPGESTSQERLEDLKALGYL